MNQRYKVTSGNITGLETANTGTANDPTIQEMERRGNNIMSYNWTVGAAEPGVEFTFSTDPVAAWTLVAMPARWSVTHIAHAYRARLRSYTHDIWYSAKKIIQIMAWEIPRRILVR